jgi:hypothetical protein
MKKKFVVQRKEKRQDLRSRKNREKLSEP